MTKTRAKTIRDDQLGDLLDQVTTNAADPQIMKLVFLLSYTAGLRVQEIAGLRWSRHILEHKDTFFTREFPVRNSMTGKFEYDMNGNAIRSPRHCIYIGGDISKYGRNRFVPMRSVLHTELVRALSCRDTENPFVIPSGKGAASQELKKKAHALKMRINRLYIAMEREGFTSHSGRRTFITNAAQTANVYRGSLQDVRYMAGHKDLTTTQGYIEMSEAQADIVDGMYAGID